jgi:hypothetical protein
MHWFLLFDLLIGAVLAMLDGVRPSDASSCQSVSYAVLALCLLQLVGALVARPYASVIYNVYFVGIAGLSVVSTVTLVWGGDDGAALSDNISAFAVWGSGCLLIFELALKLTSVNAAATVQFAADAIVAAQRQLAADIRAGVPLDPATFADALRSAIRNAKNLGLNVAAARSLTADHEHSAAHEHSVPLLQVDDVKMTDEALAAFHDASGAGAADAQGAAGAAGRRRS